MNFSNPKIATTLACLAALAVPFTAACHTVSETPLQPTTDNQRLATIKDMGNGVLLLPKKDSILTIAALKSSNPDLEIVTMTDGPFTAYTHPFQSGGIAGPTNVILVTKDAHNSKASSDPKTPINLEDHGIKRVGDGIFLFPKDNFPQTLSQFIGSSNDQVATIGHGQFQIVDNPNGKGNINVPVNFLVITEQK